MNRGPRCAQTDRSERTRGTGEAQTAGENKTVLLFQGSRGGVFPSFFYLQVQSVVWAQLRVLGGAASSAQDPSAGSLGGLGGLGSGSVFCQLSVMKKDKLLRPLVGKTTKISYI